MTRGQQNQVSPPSMSEDADPTSTSRLSAMDQSAGHVVNSTQTSSHMSQTRARLLAQEEGLRRQLLDTSRVLESSRYFGEEISSGAQPSSGEGPAIIDTPSRSNNQSDSRVSLATIRRPSSSEAPRTGDESQYRAGIGKANSDTLPLVSPAVSAVRTRPARPVGASSAYMLTPTDPTTTQSQTQPIPYTSAHLASASSYQTLTDALSQANLQGLLGSHTSEQRNPVHQVSTAESFRVPSSVPPDPCGFVSASAYRPYDTLPRLHIPRPEFESAPIYSAPDSQLQDAYLALEAEQRKSAHLRDLLRRVMQSNASKTRLLGKVVSLIEDLITNSYIQDERHLAQFDQLSREFASTFGASDRERDSLTSRELIPAHLLRPPKVFTGSQRVPETRLWDVSDLPSAHEQTSSKQSAYPPNLQPEHLPPPRRQDTTHTPVSPRSTSLDDLVPKKGELFSRFGARIPASVAPTPIEPTVPVKPDDPTPEGNKGLTRPSNLADSRALRTSVAQCQQPPDESQPESHESSEVHETQATSNQQIGSLTPPSYQLSHSLKPMSQPSKPRPASAHSESQPKLGSQSKYVPASPSNAAPTAATPIRASGSSSEYLSMLYKLRRDSAHAIDELAKLKFNVTSTMSSEDQRHIEEEEEQDQEQANASEAYDGEWDSHDEDT